MRPEAVGALIALSSALFGSRRKARTSDEAGAEDTVDDQTEQEQAGRAFRVLKKPMGEGVETEQLRLSPDCKVVVQFVGTVTRRAIKKLVEHYQSNIGVYPEATESE